MSGRCLSGRLLSGGCLSGGLRPYILVGELHIAVIFAHKYFNICCLGECSISRQCLSSRIPPVFPPYSSCIEVRATCNSNVGIWLSSSTSRQCCAQNGGGLCSDGM